MEGRWEKTKKDYQRVFAMYDKLKSEKRLEEEGKRIRTSLYLGAQFFYDTISEEIGYQPNTVRKIINDRVKLSKRYGIA
jgi:hypothetical protein